MGPLVLFLILGSSLVSAVSNSDAVNVFNCDARSTLWGCEPRFWEGGNRLRCSNRTTQIMAWATKTVRSNCYQLIAGEEASPVTRYIPNEYLQIHVRVTCHKMNYRGLLLYAVNATERKVGDWEIPNNEPPLFVEPWESMPTHQCAGSVMHASAEWKPYHTVLYFKAPPAGSGTITFRALFKYGNANTGDFFWPQTDISLQEAPTRQTTLTWRQSTAGQSCTEVCGSQCSETALSGLNGPSTMIQQIIPKYPCQLPLLSGCGADGATFDPTQELCYYVDSTCAAQNRTPSTVTCATKRAGVVRFCPCDTAVTAGLTATSAPDLSNSAGVASGSDNSADAESPASRSGPSMLLSLFLFPLLLAGVDRRFVLGLLLFSGLALGHNWINSVSRSPAASTYRPCKPPVTDLPHAQVGPNQAFQIEWMNGHGDFTYFVIIHSKDVDKLKLHTTTMLNDYISKAPAGSNQALLPNLQRFHLKTNPSLNNEVADNNVTNYFKGLIDPSDTRYIVRPTVFGSTNLRFQMEYKEPELAGDARVSYRSTIYPWIEAVYKFRLSTLNPSRPDTANFYIPGYGGTGRYIVQYLWRGYYDCVDVDYKPTAVASVYGLPFNGTRWSRIDHCLFEDVRRVYHSSRIYSDPRYCLNLCTFTDCFGVNVVPLRAPSTVYQSFRPRPGTSWAYPNVYGTDMYVPWTNGFFNATRDQYIAGATPSAYMCYTVHPREFTDTMDEYTVSNDPEDPIFYSTCFYRFRGNNFDDYANKTSGDSILPWRYNDECIDCANRAANTDTQFLFPKWTSPSVCVNCDREPKAAPITPPLRIVESAARCDGSLTNVFARPVHHTCPNTTVCWKQLRAHGRPNMVVTVADCAALAADDTTCGNTYFYRQASQACYCYNKAPCCRNCSRIPDATYVTYEQTSSADPTCATGVLSADGNSCCSASCGANNCVATTTAVNPVGFCCSTCITRPCSQYGPPCRVV